MQAIEGSKQEFPIGRQVRTRLRRLFAVRWSMCAAGILSVAAMAVHAVSANAAPGDGFELPIACKLGTSCWIVNYPDAGPESVGRDFKCNHLTYDGHTGTDFAIRDLEAMRHSVRVVAAMAGEVLRVRDGVGDRGLVDATQRQGCGNGMVVSHGDGWETQYCHLRDGSVAVRPGERVQRGDRLGLVGMSGHAEFPHVELTVRRNGVTLDPFTGLEVFSGCGIAGQSLWHEDVRPMYAASQVVAVGFASGRVDMASLQRDALSPSVLSTETRRRGRPLHDLSLGAAKAPTCAAAIAQLKAEGKCPMDTRHRQVKYTPTPCATPRPSNCSRPMWTSPRSAIGSGSQRR